MAQYDLHDPPPVDIYQLHENLLKLDNIKNYKYFMQYLKVMCTEIDLELVGYNFIIISFILQMS